MQNLWAILFNFQPHNEASPVTDRNSNTEPARFIQSPPLPPITKRAIPQTQSSEEPAPTGMASTPGEQEQTSKRISPVQVSFLRI